MVEERNSTIDWLNHYMTLPLAKAVAVQSGDVVNVSFQYRAGGSIPSLQLSLRAEIIYDSALQPAFGVPAYA